MIQIWLMSLGEFCHYLNVKKFKNESYVGPVTISSVMITLTLVALFASVIFNTAKQATDIENNVQIYWFTFRKDINSETIVKKKGQTVTNNDFHKGL